MSSTRSLCIFCFHMELFLLKGNIICILLRDYLSKVPRYCKLFVYICWSLVVQEIIGIIVFNLISRPFHKSLMKVSTSIQFGGGDYFFRISVRGFIKPEVSWWSFEINAWCPMTRLKEVVLIYIIWKNISLLLKK